MNSYIQDVGFEFEIGSPFAMRTVAKKIADDLGIKGLKAQVDVTVETPQKYNGELSAEAEQYLEF